MTAAAKLWNVGQSQHQACDPLFSAWLKAGKLSDEIVWARMLEAFDARQRSLMDYVARKGSEELQPWAEKLRAAARHLVPGRSLLALRLNLVEQPGLPLAVPHSLAARRRYPEARVAVASLLAQRPVSPVVAAFGHLPRGDQCRSGHHSDA
mgnify:CR=1 FL=1